MKLTECICGLSSQHLKAFGKLIWTYGRKKKLIGEKLRKSEIEISQTPLKIINICDLLSHLPILFSIVSNCFSNTSYYLPLSIQECYKLPQIYE